MRPSLQYSQTFVSVVQVKGFSGLKMSVRISCKLSRKVSAYWLAKSSITILLIISEGS